MYVINVIEIETRIFVTFSLYQSSIMFSSGTKYGAWQWVNVCCFVLDKNFLGHVAAKSCVAAAAISSISGNQQGIQLISSLHYHLPE